MLAHHLLLASLLFSCRHGAPPGGGSGDAGLGSPPPVLDAADVLSAPESLLTQLCVRLELPFVFAGVPGAPAGSGLGDVWLRTTARVAATDDLRSAVQWADIISCATLATDPLILGEWLLPGQHLDLVGSFTAGMREADMQALQRAIPRAKQHWLATKTASHVRWHTSSTSSTPT